MKIKILLLALLLPILSFAQNPFDVRTNKKPTGKIPSIQAERIDGRQSTAANFLAPSALEKANLNNAKTIKYHVKHEPTNGLPIWLDVIKPKTKGDFGVANNTEEYTLQSVLADLPGLFLWDENTTLLQENSETDELGITHIRYAQYYKGVKINGGIWILHIKDNQVISGNGRIYPSRELAVTNPISSKQALKNANTYVAQNLHEFQNSTFDFIDRTPKTDLVIDFEITTELKPHLVYKIEVRPTDMHVYEVYVDANTGKILLTIDLLCSIDGPKTATATDLNNQSRSINTYQKGSSYYLIDATKSMFNAGQSAIPNDPVGAVWTINANNTDATSVTQISSGSNSWSDKSSVSAHYNAGLAFDYYKNTFNRNSINGSGGTIISVINVTDNGSSMANAYWNGQAMFYGNGGTSFKPLAGALDVAGHELTHGVVSNSANLEYKGQSGAINESMADIFGAMIDRDDWKMGEDVVKTTVFKSGALRDLQDPHNGGTSLSNNGYQPAKMSEFYTGSQDNGGVHINSGIVNKAYYLIATAIGKDKAEKMYYRALTVYLTSKSQFLDLRYAAEKSATDLYGATELAAVKSAFDQVEIYDPNAGSGGGSGGGSTGGSDIPTNTGIENIISVDLNTADANTFYKSTTTPDGWQPLSQRTPKRKGSVTDKGDYMYYVSSTNILYRVQLTSPYTETQVSNDLWDNVAISKNGKLLAAVTTEVDSSIWVYNFDLASWKRFQLYNPTYTQGVSGGNVLYADAIEFDNTGQFILYDARNIIESNFGTDIDYWDVGLLRIWDNTANGWGDGKIDKIFTQLPEDISIGNATYAKNSPYIIAFDYIDANAGDYAILGTNIITSETGVIYEQTDLGYPNFSNKDDKIIFDATTTGGDPVIGVQQLADTKIEAKSGTSASILISDGKWGVWYANGTRNLLSDKKDMLSFAFSNLSNQPEGNIVGTTITIEVPSGTNLTSITPTFTYSSDATVTVNSTIQTSGVDKQNFSSNVIYKITAQDGTSKNYLVKVTTAQASIDEIAKQITLYPNPSSSQLYIASAVYINTIKVYGADGKEINVNWNKNSVDVSSLATGIYFIEIQTEQGKITKRFSKI
jgi:Zn-dependent metalloprotease